MRCFENLKYAQYEPCLLDMLVPDSDEFDVIVWFHGGGLEKGSRKGFLQGMGKDLAERGFAVASADYRLYPQARFPEYAKDAARAVRYVIEHADMYGNPGRIFIGGSSAGAYLTLMLALDRSCFREAGVDPARISGYLSNSAQVTVHFNVLRERGMNSKLERIDEAAPLYFLSPDSDFGNLLLICYENDIKSRPEQNRLLYSDINRICPQNRVVFRRLPGKHCAGTSHRNARGSYDFLDAFDDFLSPDAENAAAEGEGSRSMERTDTDQ